MVVIEAFLTEIVPKQLGQTSHAHQTHGCFGLFRGLSCLVIDIQQSETPDASAAAAIVFASDHPVSHLGEATLGSHADDGHQPELAVPLLRCWRV